MDYEARLGDRVKDRVSGFTGVVVSLHTFLLGCDRMTVQPPIGEDGKLPDTASFDAPDLIVIEKQVAPYQLKLGREYIGDLELGDMVRDAVSGFEGVAVARHVYLNGTDRISVQPIVKGKDRALPEARVFEAPQLAVTKREYVKYEAPKEERRKTGGPAKYTPEPRETGGRRPRDPSDEFKSGI